MQALLFPCCSRPAASQHALLRQASEGSSMRSSVPLSAQGSSLLCPGRLHLPNPASASSRPLSALTPAPASRRTLLASAEARFQFPSPDAEPEAQPAGLADWDRFVDALRDFHKQSPEEVRRERGSPGGPASAESGGRSGGAAGLGPSRGSLFADAEAEVVPVRLPLSGRGAGSPSQTMGQVAPGVLPATHSHPHPDSQPHSHPHSHSETHSHPHSPPRTHSDPQSGVLPGAHSQQQQQHGHEHQHEHGHELEHEQRHMHVNGDHRQHDAREHDHSHGQSNDQSSHHHHNDQAQDLQHREDSTVSHGSSHTHTHTHHPSHSHSHDHDHDHGTHHHHQHNNNSRRDCITGGATAVHSHATSGQPPPPPPPEIPLRTPPAPSTTWEWAWEDPLPPGGSLEAGGAPTPTPSPSPSPRKLVQVSGSWRPRGSPLEPGAGVGKLLFVDAQTAGAAGDMMAAALLDLGVPVGVLDQGLQGLGLDGFSCRVEGTERSAITAPRFIVTESGRQPFRDHAVIRRVLQHQSALPPGAVEIALAAFQLLAQAEASVHGVPVESVHFHEVGAIDSIVDIVATSIALDYLGLKLPAAQGAGDAAAPMGSRGSMVLAVSWLPMGRGIIRGAAHGPLPCPAPATLDVLCRAGIPTFDAGVEGEFVTPTGACLLGATQSSVTPWPAMVPERAGYGSGTKRWPDRPNLLRLVLGRPARA